MIYLKNRTLLYKMYREIIIPTHTKQTIEFPEEFIGKQVEIIAFPIDGDKSNLTDNSEAYRFWKKNSIDMSNFKFDRTEANEH